LVQDSLRSGRASFARLGSPMSCDAARAIHDKMLLFSKWGPFASPSCVLKQESR